MGKKKKKKDRALGICGRTKDPTFISWVPEKRKSEAKRVLKEIMAENFPDLAKDTNLKI